MDSIASTVRVIELANTLRAVRSAGRRFLLLWAAQDVREHASGLISPTSPDNSDDIPNALDPFNRDWTLLYRGSVLDD